MPLHPTEACAPPDLGGIPIAAPVLRHLQAMRDSGGSIFGRDDWINLEFDNVAPVGDPLIEKCAICCFHYLEASFEFLVDPARNILQALWSHSPVIAKSSVDRQRIRVFEMFNDHK